MTRVNFKNRKDAFLSATKVVAMALVIGLVAVSCGKDDKDDNGGGNDAEKGKSFTAGAKTKMETLGKSVKNVKLVYYMITSDCRQYYAETFENGTNTEVKMYWFYYEGFGENYKTSVKQFEDAENLLDKDDNNLWVQLQNDTPSKLSWQETYDLFKSMKNSVIVE